MQGWVSRGSAEYSSSAGKTALDRASSGKNDRIEWGVKMRKFKCAALGSVLLMAIGAMAAPIQVLLVDGASGGSFHNWKLTTPVLKAEMEETGLFQVTVATAPESGGEPLPGDCVEL
jgi:hypothetical protein